jgi:hypothetical protein
MEKKTLIAVSVGGIIIAGGIGYYLYSKSKVPVIVEVPVVAPTTLPIVTATAPVSTLVSKGFPIVLGTNGSTEVKSMQNALRSKFNKLSIVSDGSFGPKTLDALNEIGYSSPVSESDFKKILDGKKNTVAPVVNPFKNGDIIYSKINNLGLYTKPVVDAAFLKKSFNIYDKVGLYYGPSTVDGWCKVFVSELGLTLFTKTTGVTNIKA